MRNTREIERKMLHNEHIIETENVCFTTLVFI